MPRLETYWDSVNPISLALLPLSLLFATTVALRRLAYRAGLRPVRQFAVPVLVVGNLTVGGTGKTPLVIWLAKHLRGLGWRPGIVARGYGGRARFWPQQVRSDSDPAMVGDEAVLLATATRCPVCVGPDRPAAVAAMLEHTDVDLVLSDDGMQHYALGRDLEIAVIDGRRRLGNGFLLPAGPLREPASRLRDADLVVANGPAEPGEYSMHLQRPSLRELHTDREVELADFAGCRVHAVAGIGNPRRFFELLTGLGMQVEAHPFPDHHAFRAADLAFEDGLPVLMTAKDAVKCRRIAGQDCWVLDISTQPDSAFIRRLEAALKDIVDGQKVARNSGMSDL